MQKPIKAMFIAATLFAATALVTGTVAVVAGSDRLGGVAVIYGSAAFAVGFCAVVAWDTFMERWPNGNRNLGGMSGHSAGRAYNIARFVLLGLQPSERFTDGEVDNAN